MSPTIGAIGSFFSVVREGLVAGGALVPMTIVGVPILPKSKWVFIFFGGCLPTGGLLIVSAASLAFLAAVKSTNFF